MKIQMVYEDGKLNLAMGARNLDELKQLIQQFMDPIAKGLGYEIVLKKSDKPASKVTANSKFKEI